MPSLVCFLCCHLTSAAELSHNAVLSRFWSLFRGKLCLAILKQLVPLEKAVYAAAAGTLVLP